MPVYICPLPKIRTASKKYIISEFCDFIISLESNIRILIKRFTAGSVEKRKLTRTIAFKRDPRRQLYPVPNMSSYEF